MNPYNNPLARRRGFMAAAAAGLALPLLAPPARAVTAAPTGTERGATRVAGFADAEMDFQLMRQLGAARYGGASVGECFALAQRIQNGQPASWVNEFAAAAVRQEEDAQARARRGHALSARDQYLVACNNYRAAEYYCGVLDPRHAALGLKSRECFLAAMLRDPELACEEAAMPFGSKLLPAYYFRAPQAGRRQGKTLIIISGYDGTLKKT